MACHTRSISLPTRSHPFILKAEEDLNKLKTCLASPSLSYEIMLDALKAVGHVYECLNNLLCIPSNINGFSHSQQRRFVDQELEESIKLIDICSTSRDNLDSIKGQIQDLELAIRRGEPEVLRSEVREYILLVKKASKDVKKLHAIKTHESTNGDSAVASLLLQTREITISLLQSLFSFLPKQIVAQKTSKWCAVKRLLQKRRVACKDEQEEDVFDISYLRVNVEGLENELDILFRHLIKCRVSLLNMCSL